MNTGRWGAIEPILDKALELDEGDRLAFIKYACKEDKELEKEIIALLKAIQTSEDEDFLGDSSSENGALIQNLAKERVASHFIGKRIGAFKLTEQIGSGGMSAVFKGERADGQFDQQVAVKLIRSGLHSKQILRRFELEKQILATLSHSHIARLYDGGITAGGNPYLIMEYIQGKPIDRYCDGLKLSVDERLRLFQQVCSGVEYAHNNLIVHRDLKAQNIYVTEDGLVKILDFGIAKLLEAKLKSEELLRTQPGRELWTPQYASPEQMNGEAITTSSDIYSLGVLLHKLLADSYPFNFNGKSITQIRAVVVNEAPDSLLKSLHKNEDSAKAAEKRSTTFAHLEKMLKGDLEAITGKALRKKVSERYNSVRKLAEDVENYRNNLPVMARRGNASYKFRKFIKRHKKGIGVAASSFLIIVCLTIFYTHRLSQQKQQAVYAANKAAKVSTLLKNILRQSSPYVNEEVTLKQILIKGERQIKNKLQDQPLLKAEMLGVLGDIYIDLGKYKKAEKLLNNSLSIQNGLNRQESGLRALTLIHFGNLFYWQGYFKESIDSLQKAENLLTGMKNVDYARLLSLYNAMGMAYGQLSKYEKSISLYKKSLQLMPDNKQEQRTVILKNLGIAYQRTDQFKKALQTYRADLKLIRALTDVPTPLLATVHLEMAVTYQRMGNVSTADSLHRIALEMRKRILPPAHPHIAESLNYYGLLKIEQGKPEEAEKMIEQAYLILNKILPDDHWHVASSRGSLALARGLQGHFEKAVPILEKLYKRYEKQFGSDDWRTRWTFKAYQSVVKKQRSVENRR